MAGSNMSKLVPDDHVASRSVVAAGLEKIAEQHDHVAAHEPRRERIAHAVLLHQVHIWHASQSEALRELRHAIVELRELVRAETNGAAADRGDERDVHQPKDNSRPREIYD